MAAHNDIQNKLTDYLDCPSRQVVIGYSGGVDSHLLLHWVASLAAQFSQHQYLAVHINHGLSKNADAWQQHCQRVCDQLAIEFHAVSVHIDKRSSKGLESAARDARYRALESVTQHNGIILLGQHLDDQLETFLLQLKRGAGPKGLSAMPQAQNRENGVVLVRPLLGISQKQILDLAGQANLQWIDDESNLDERFERNFLRQKIVPQLLQRWPDMAQSVQRSAQLCAEQQMLLEEIASTYLQSIKRDGLTLHIPALLAYSVPWQNQIVRLWLSELELSMPSKAVLSELHKLLNAKQDAAPKIVFGDYQFRRFRDQLFCVRNYQSIPRTKKYPLSGRQIVLPAGLGVMQFKTLPKTLTTGRVYLRAAALSYKFKPATLPHSKPLKQWFKQWDIPVWLREQSLLLFHDEKCLGVWFDGQLIFSHEAPEELKSCVEWRANLPVL